MASAQAYQQGGKVEAPAMDSDYNYYASKYQSQPPPPPPPSRNARSPRELYQLGVVPMEPVMEDTPTRYPAHITPDRVRERDENSPAAYDPQTPSQDGTPEQEVNVDEALLDLAQLEELHHEAERMKALGNKHMAAQVRNVQLKYTYIHTDTYVILIKSPSSHPLSLLF
jgi:hypothetical protein